MMNTPLRLKNVSFSYDHPILTGVNFDLSAGKVVSVGGGAGSGKSIFLKIAAGLIEPDDGEIFLLGENFWQRRRSERTKIKKEIAFFFSEGALLANTTVFDNLALPLRYHQSLGQNEIASRINPLLERFGLLKYRDQLPASLSLKLKRLVSLARALLIEKPEIYFWDGPELLEGEEKRVAADVISRASAGGIPSLIIGDSVWTKGLCSENYTLVDGNLKAC